MSDFDDARVRRALGIHDKIAADLPKGGTLTCLQCGREDAIRDGDVARYLARGWPKCHGATMRWDHARP